METWPILTYPTYYILYTGINEAYLNFTSLSTLKVSEASYESRPAVRVAAVSNKYKVLTVLSLSNQNRTSFRVNMTFGEGEDKYQVSDDETFVCV